MLTCSRPRNGRFRNGGRETCDGTLNLGNAVAESGGNAGSDFALYRYDDTGNAIDAPLAIDRKTGAVTAKGVTNGSDAQPGMIGEANQVNLDSHRARDEDR